MKYIFFSILIFQIVFDALGDSTKNKFRQHFYQVMMIISLFMAFNLVLKFGYEIDFWRIILGYVLLRYAIFDILYNVLSKLSWCYIGNTSYYDKVLKWITRDILKVYPSHFFFLTKLIAFLTATGIFQLFYN